MEELIPKNSLEELVEFSSNTRLRYAEKAITSAKDSLKLKNEAYKYYLYDSSSNVSVQVVAKFEMRCTDCIMLQEDGFNFPIDQCTSRLHTRTLVAIVAEDDNQYQHIRLAMLDIEIRIPQREPQVYDAIHWQPVLQADGIGWSKRKFEINVATSDTWNTLPFDDDGALRLQIKLRLAKNPNDSYAVRQEELQRRNQWELEPRGPIELVSFVMGCVKDFVFITDNNQSVPTYSELLKMKSPILKSWIEMNDTNEVFEMQVNITESALNFLLHWMGYGVIKKINFLQTPEDAQDLSQANILEILKFGHAWDLSHLLIVLDTLMDMHVTEYNARTLLHFAKQYSLRTSVQYLEVFLASQANALPAPQHDELFIKSV